MSTPIETTQRWCAYCGEAIIVSPCPCKPPTLEAAMADAGAREYESWATLIEGKGTT